MTVKLLNVHHLKFLAFKEGCIGSSESSLVKMPQCVKSCKKRLVIKYAHLDAEKVFTSDIWGIFYIQLMEK